MIRPRLPLSMWRAPRWPGRPEAARPLILLYHSIARLSSDPWGVRVSPRNFAEHVAVLKEHARPMSLRDLHAAVQAGELPARAVALTFDDGYVDNLLAAKPVLMNYRVPATVFVASGFVGNTREFWWDELDRMLLQPGQLPDELSVTIGADVLQADLGAGARYTRAQAWTWRRWTAWQEPGHPRHELYLRLWRALHGATTQDREAALQQLRTWSVTDPLGRPERLCVTPEQLDELACGGLIDIGAHTVTHPSLAALPVDEQREEIIQSGAALEAMLQRPIEGFAYPFGSERDYTAETAALVREAGYQFACVVGGGSLQPNHDPFHYPRWNVLDWDGAEFARRLASWFDHAEAPAAANA